MKVIMKMPDPTKDWKGQAMCYCGAVLEIDRDDVHCRRATDQEVLTLKDRDRLTYYVGCPECKREITLRLIYEVREYAQHKQSKYGHK